MTNRLSPIFKATVGIAALLFSSTGLSTAAQSTSMALNIAAQPSIGDPNDVMISATISNAGTQIEHPVVGPNLWRTLTLIVVDSSGKTVQSTGAVMDPSLVKVNGPIRSESIHLRTRLLRPGQTYRFAIATAPLANWGYGALAPGTYHVTGLLRVQNPESLESVQSQSMSIQIQR